MTYYEGSLDFSLFHLGFLQPQEKGVRKEINEKKKKIKHKRVENYKFYRNVELLPYKKKKNKIK